MYSFITALLLFNPFPKEMACDSGSLRDYLIQAKEWRGVIIGPVTTNKVEYAFGSDGSVYSSNVKGRGKWWIENGKFYSDVIGSGEIGWNIHFCTSSFIQLQEPPRSKSRCMTLKLYGGS
jgi:hypothetical protein